MVAGHNRRGIGSADNDITNERIGRTRRQLEQQGQLISTMPGGSGAGNGVPGAALPAGSISKPPQPAQSMFILGQRTKRKGAIVRMAFYIDKTTTKVTCRIIGFKDNFASGSTAEQGRSQIVEDTWNDITDEEREAGYLTREFKVALEFEAVYGVVRTIAVNDEDGLTRTIKFPKEKDKPFMTLPFPIVNAHDSGRVDTGVDACFRTGNRDGSVPFTNVCNIGDATMVQPRPHPTEFVMSQRIKPAGAKPLFKVVVPKNAVRLRIVLIRHDDVGTGTSAFNNRIADSWDIGESDLMMVNDGQVTETDARYVTVRFGKFLDLGVQYDAILFTVRGDNVDGDGGDFVRNPAADFFQFGTDPNPTDPTNPNNGRFIAGVTTAGNNSLLKEDTPFVAMNVLTDFVLKRRGVKAIMHVLMPSASEELRIRVIETQLNGSGIAGSPTLADRWDDIQVTNDGASGVTGQIKVQRRFGPTLDFNSRYKLKALVAEGPDVGLGSDKAVYNPPAEVTFITPGPDGTFLEPGGGLTFGGTVASLTKFKKNGNGVFIGMKIFAPKGTESVTVRVQKLIPGGGSQATNTNEILDYTFEDVADDIASSLDSSFRGQYGIKLDPDEDGLSSTENYGIVRLIARGDGINEDGAGGLNPNVYRNPISKPATGEYVAKFSTIPTLSFANATTPSPPIRSDLTNTTENDMPKVTFRVWASNKRGSAAGGTALLNLLIGIQAGAITFGDLGAIEAFLVVNRVSAAGGDNGMTDKRKISVAVGPDQCFVDIEIDEVILGRRYYIPRVGLSSGTDMVKQQARNNAEAEIIAGAFSTPDPLNAIKFRAGFEIDLDQLEPQNLQVPAAIAPDRADRRIQIVAIDAIDSRSSIVTVRYTEPVSPVLIRNMKFFKDVLGKTADFKPVNMRVLKDETENFTAGIHDVNFEVTHPAGAQIRYKAEITPVQGGTVPTDGGVSLAECFFPSNQSSPTYTLTGVDIGVTDPGPPFYQNKQPRLRCKFKPAGFNINFRLPDGNMKTHKTNYVALRFATSEKQFGVVLPVLTHYYLDPKNDTFFSRPGQLGIPDPRTSPDLFVEIGKGSEAFIGFDRPMYTKATDGSNSKDGDFIDGLAAVLTELRRVDALPNSFSYLEFLCIIENESIPNFPFKPYLILFSTQIPFDMGSNDRTFLGRADFLTSSNVG